LSTSSTSANPDKEKQENQSPRFIYQDEQLPDKSFDWGQMSRLATYMKPYAKQMLPIIIIMLVVETVTKLTIPLIISYTIDHAFVENGNVELLITMVSSMFALYVVQWLANSYQIRYTSVVGQRVIYDLRHELFSHIPRGRLSRLNSPD
jgi:ATP-binding cassette, subfamily B, multidrug efflux pump